MSDQSEVESSHEENQETKTDLEPATAQQDGTVKTYPPFEKTGFRGF